MGIEFSNQPLVETFDWFLDSSKGPRFRRISDWVEDEIILPNGPYANQRYRHRYHPVSRLWFEAVDSGNWSRFAASGPTQNGKSLMCYVAPVLYHLFEIVETVSIGLPDMNMANDKWTEDFLPVINASRYADLLPTKGEGSRGGQVRRSIHFENGATLRFFSGGGGDKKRAGYTTRVLAVTETDGMDEPGESSRESDKIEQLEGRTRAFGDNKRIYLECTVSIERGRIWQEIKHGTDTRIFRPCPKCGVFVCPDREHLVGWKSALTEHEARVNSHWVCPACESPWTESERFKAAEYAIFVHRGQDITADGKLIGDPVKTQTFGLRWSAIDNPFATAAQVGAEEWMAVRSKERDNSEKKMRQFVWAIPYEPPEITLTPLDPDALRSKKSAIKRGELPPECVGLAIGVDTGKRALHWDAKAVCANGSRVVIAYGRQTVEADRLGTFQGIVEALASLRTFLEIGFSGRRPDQVWIDSGYHEHTDAVYAFCELANQGLQRGQERYRPTKGDGEGQRMQPYRTPQNKTANVMYVGKEFHIRKVERNGKILPGVLLVHVNSDYWKSELHQRLVMPPNENGAVTFYDDPDPYHHSDYIAHMTSERQVEKFYPIRGTVITWDRIRRENHWFDAGYSSLCATEFILEMTKKAAPRPRVPLAQMKKETR